MVKKKRVKAYFKYQVSKIDAEKMNQVREMLGSE